MIACTLTLLSTLLICPVQDPTEGEADLLSKIGPPPEEGVEVLYLGEEAFLFRSKRKAVLVDPYLEGPEDGAPRIPQPVLQAIGSAEGPFRPVDHCVATHAHEEGFRTELGKAFLESRHSPILEGPPQAMNLFRTVLEESNRKHYLRDRWRKPGDENRMIFPGLFIDYLNLPHAGDDDGEIQYLGLVLRTGGVKIAHFPQAAPEAEDLAVYRSAVTNPDVAIVSSEFVLDEDNLKMLRQRVVPRQVIVAGLPEENRDELTKKLQEALPDVIILAKPMDRLLVEPRKRR